MAKDGLLEHETGLSAVAQQLEGLPVPDRLFGRAAAICDPGREAGELCPASGVAQETPGIAQSRLSPRRMAENIAAVLPSGHPRRG